MVPYLNAIVNMLQKAEKSSIYRFGIKMLAKIPKLSVFTRGIIRADQKLLNKSYEILKNIAALLQKAGLDFAYLYGEEIFNGALLFDLGLEEAFITVGKRVIESFRKTGARKIITIDPHSYHILKSVYPEYFEDFDFEVVSYLEILEDKLNSASMILDDEFTIHDACYYARYEGLYEEPRKLLQRAGARIKEPKRSKLLTGCCGGPIETTSPSMAEKIALSRLRELAEASSNIITLCPICYANFVRCNRHLDLKIYDISEVLAKAFL